MQNLDAPPPFPVIESFVNGGRLLASHARLFLVLSFFPFLVTLATLVALRFLSKDLTMFWLPVIQFPSSFVIGLQCALILRFVILHESPIIEDGPARAHRNRAVMQAAFVYAAITYFVTGAYAGLLKLRMFLVVNPTEAAAYVPLAIAAVVFLIWGARWFWLHVPLALGWQVSGFYERIGKWQGSVRVFCLFALCSIVMNFAAGFARILIGSFSNSEGGFSAAFDDAAVAAATVMLAVMFTTATAAAIKSMLGKRDVRV